MKLNRTGRRSRRWTVSFGHRRIIGGSQGRDYDKLLARMQELKDGSFPVPVLSRSPEIRDDASRGLGLGFERCVMYLTGMTNIRDVLPYPRTVGNCEL